MRSASRRRRRRSTWASSSPAPRRAARPERRPPADYLSVFFAESDTSRAAGQQAAGRIFGARTVDRDTPTSWQTRLAQYDAVCAWGQPNHALLERVSAIEKPVFVANGDSDPMILPRYSYLLAGLIPRARLKLYPDAAHGVPHAAHVFAHGPHSLGLARGNGDAAAWTTLAAAWITEQLNTPVTHGGRVRRPDEWRRAGVRDDAGGDVRRR